MQCNIDARGKAMRLVGGLIAVILGVIAAVARASGALEGWGWTLAAVLLLAAGAFQIFEGWAGWCVLRAMGVRTRF